MRFLSFGSVVLFPACLLAGTVRVEPGTGFSDVVRAAERAKASSGPAEVVLASGEYPVMEPVEIGAGLDGVVFRSADREHPAVVTGGRVIRGWEAGTDGVWRVRLADVAAGRWNFSQLFVNGVRRYRPRVPEDGWYESVDHTRIVDDGARKGAGGFTYGGDVLSSAWANREDLEVQMLLRWNGARMRIAEIDEAAHEVVLTSLHPSLTHLSLKGNRFAVENVKEAFGRPGQWYLDRPSGVLSYRPLPGERLENVRIEAPFSPALLRICGAHGVRFENIVFRLDNHNTPKETLFSSQAEIKTGAAVDVRASQDVSFDGCVFVNLGGWAVSFDGACRGGGVRSGVIADIGAGGVRIGTVDASARGITVADCEIREGGRRDPGGPAIAAIKAHDCRFLRNEIRDFYYTGISVGWGWKVEEVPSSSHNEIAYNHIHDIGLRQLSDMGLVYLLCRQPGTRVHHNYLHDIRHWGYGSTGIYPDECSAHLEIDHNFVRGSGRSLHCNMVRDLNVHDNVFIDGDLVQYDFSNNLGEEEDLLHLHHNTFIWTGGDLARRRKSFKGDPQALQAYTAPFWKGVDLHENVYWRRDGRTDVFPPENTFVNELKGLTLAEFQAASGQERGSVYRDPGEIDVESVTGRTGVSPEAVHATWAFPEMPRPFGLYEQYVVRRAPREFELRNGIGTFLGKLEAGRPVTVAYFGGSITEGTSWRPLVTEWMNARYPKSVITEINAGIGGTGSNLGVYRLEHDVLRYNPDLVFIEFSCNDRDASSVDPARVGACSEQIVRSIWQHNPETDIVFLHTITRAMLEEYGKGVLDRFAAIHETVATKYGIPSVLPKEGTGFQSITNFLAQTMPKDACVWNRENLVRAAPYSLDAFTDTCAVEIRKDMLRGTSWCPVATNDSRFARFLSRTDSMWVGTNPGDALEFDFEGAEVSLYALWGPSGARLEVTVDGERRQPRDLFDRYCSYWRLMPTPVYRGPWGRHHVRIEIGTDQPDRDPVRRYRKLSDERMRSGEFDGHTAAIGWLLLDGRLK